MTDKPPSDRADEVDQLIRLITYCRNNGYRLGAVQLGSLRLAIEDLRLDAREGLKPDLYRPRGPEELWEAAGLDGPPAEDGTIG